MKESLVSVIIPCYNAELYVEEAVRSIMNQSYKNLEIIVINDGSKDNTKDVLLKLSKEDSRIVYVENETNIKLIATLNKGIRLANGEYIARMDADDIALKNRIKKQTDFLKKNPQVAVLGSTVNYFGLHSKQKKVSQPVTDIEIRSKMFVASPFHHPTVIFNMNVLNKEVLIYDDKYYRAEDYGLWVKLMKNKKYVFANLPDSLLDYRVLETSESNLSRQNLKLKNAVLIKIYEQLFESQDFSITKGQLVQYVFAVDRSNFDEVNSLELLKIYQNILKQNDEFNLLQYLSIRWLAILIIKPKIVIKSIIRPDLVLKFTFFGVYFFIREKIKMK